MGKFNMPAGRKRGPNKLNARQVREIRALRWSGHTLKTISERYDVTQPAVGYHVRDIPIGRLPMGHRRLNRIDKDRAVEMLAFGSTLAEIARHFGVRPDSVSSAFKRMEYMPHGG